MNESSFNTELFNRPDAMQLWAEVVNRRIRPHVEPLAKGRKNGGMMVWWVVIMESQHCGIVKKGITYWQAASLLVAACPDYFRSPDSLANSFNSLHKSQRQHMVCELDDLYGKEVRKMLLAGVPRPRPELTADSTLQDIVAEIAEKLIDESYNRQSSFMHRGRRFEKRGYAVTPPVAIVTYPDANAISNDKPSSVTSFEIVDGELTEGHLFKFLYDYTHFGNRHHLILVARSVTSDGVVELCDQHDFGLCIVNRDGTWHRMLSRSVNDFAAISAARRALLDGHSEKKLIAYNRGEFTTLPELLKRFGVSVRQDSLLRRRHLSKDEIKQIAACRLREVGCDMNGYCVSDKNLADIASLLGVRFSFGYLPDYQLELCDFDANEITINLSLVNNECRGRFTLCHGFGHYDLQKPCVGDYTYPVGDNVHTLYASPFPHSDWKWLEWQADQNARYSLMPDEIIWNLVHRCYEPRTLRMGHLYVNDNPENIGPYLMTLREMSKLSKVSMEALSYRLIEMGLLKDERKDKKPIIFP